MSEGQIVHCPRCGASVLVRPKAVTVVVLRDYLQIDFDRSQPDHKCEESW